MQQVMLTPRWVTTLSGKSGVSVHISHAPNTSNSITPVGMADRKSDRPSKRARGPSMETGRRINVRALDKRAVPTMSIWLTT